MEKKQRKKNAMAMMGFAEYEEQVWLSEFDERDFEVSQILLELRRRQAADSERRGGEKRRIPFTVVWGSKKRLGCKARRLSGGLSSETAAAAAAAAAGEVSQLVNAVAPASSPDTPLNINQHSSESEDFSPSSSQPVKKKREELLQNLQELNDCGEKLRKEVENVSAYYRGLLASNQMWKQTKQMVESAAFKEEEKSNADTVKNYSNFGARSGQLYPQTHHHSQFFLNPNPNPNPNPTARIEPQGKLQLQYHHQQQGPSPVMYGPGPSFQMGRLSSKIGPLPKQKLAQTQSLERERARMRAEEARKRRKMLIQERQQRLQHQKSK